MTDWAADLSRATELQETIEEGSAGLSSTIDELLELAHHDQWIVQQTALETLGFGLQARPDAGVAELDALIETAVDPAVPSPSRWREGLRTVTDAAPEAMCDAVLSELTTADPTRRREFDSDVLTRLLARIAVDSPSLLAGSLDSLREINQTVPPETRVHILKIHLALIGARCGTVFPVLPDLLAEFDDGTGQTRRIAADLLCALARHPEHGTTVANKLVRWAAAHPREPREDCPRLEPRDSVLRPDLANAPQPGLLGILQVVARIAEETPETVVPLVDEIATSLATWESTRADQWSRSHLARTVAAVARQCPQDVTTVADEMAEVVADDAEFVRYWAAQTLVSLCPFRPDIVSTDLLYAFLTDSNPDIRELGSDLTEICVDDGFVDPSDLVADLVSTLSENDALEAKRGLEVLESIARHDPDAVRPALPRVAQFVDDTLTATEAATILEAVAESDPDAVSEFVPHLVDCLFTDSLTVCSAAADPLVSVGTTQPSLLDDQLPVLLTVFDEPTRGVDAVGKVLATVADRPVNEQRTVFESVLNHADAASKTERQTATRLLGTFLERGAGEPDATVTALTDRLNDEQRIHEEALDALATHVADRQSPDLVGLFYETGTDNWRSLSATLLADATLLDGSWPSEQFQRWLADQLKTAEEETRRSLVEAAGYICGEKAATDELRDSLVASLDDDTVTRTAFSAVQLVVNHGETAIPPTDLAPAVETAVLNSDRDVPASGLEILAQVSDEIAAPQQVATHLVDRLQEGRGDTGHLVAALAALCDRDLTLPATDIVAALEQYATQNTISDRDWTCWNFSPILRAADAGTEFRNTIVPMTCADSPDRRQTAFCVLAAVADEWPAAVRPIAETLQDGLQDSDVTVQDTALSALVSLGRTYPDVLRPIAPHLTTARSNRDSIDVTRRRHEGLATLAGEEMSGMDTFGFLRRGLLNSDTAVSEYALEATAELADYRLVPILERLDNGVPDWNRYPDHLSSEDSDHPDSQFESLLSSPEQTITASTVLAEFDR